MQKKLDNAKKSLKQADKAFQSHQSDVRELEAELKTTEERKSEYDEITANESQSQGRNLQLEDKQIQEYHKLKEKAGGFIIDF